jgi:UDP-glucose 4-epimerase
MRWLVTGGCGFIGRNLVRVLLAAGDDSIRVLDDLSVGTRNDLAEIDRDGRVELVVGDICDQQTTQEAVAGTDAVVHLAANTGVAPSVADPRNDCLTNVIGTFNVLEACRVKGIKRFVFASSGAPVGECEPPIHEELPAHPVSPYGASKLAGEAYCSAYNRSFGIETVALRFGNVYGPYSSHKGSVVAKFIREALAGEPWEIYGDGKQTRDFIYIDDIVDAVVRSAVTPGIGGEVFQIATSAETTVSELADRLSQVLLKHGIANLERRNGARRVGDVVRNFSDVRKARMLLSWCARVDLNEGLERTVRWFLAGGREIK